MKTITTTQHRTINRRPSFWRDVLSIVLLFWLMVFTAVFVATYNARWSLVAAFGFTIFIAIWRVVAWDESRTIEVTGKRFAKPEPEEELVRPFTPTSSSGSTIKVGKWRKRQSHMQELAINVFKHPRKHLVRASVPAGMFSNINLLWKAKVVQNEFVRLGWFTWHENGKSLVLTNTGHNELVVFIPPTLRKQLKIVTPE